MIIHMNKLIVTLLFITTTTTVFSQKILREKMSIYEDSISAKNYGMVGLYKTKSKLEKFSIGKSSLTDKMTDNKVFNIGSLTKTFTAVLVMQDIEKGNLSLQDSLSTFFPKELCSNDNVNLNITIEHLLRHRSGLKEIIVDSLFNQAYQNPFFDYNYSFLFNKIPKSDIKAGEKYQYSNTNYILLGYILELVNDKPYSEILREQIFEPCKMTNSYAYYSKNLNNVAHPMYKGEDLSDIGFFKFYQSYAFSAGAISSNTDDLLNFFTALYNSKLTSKASLQKMMTFGKEGYGLGLEQFKVNNETYIGHGGDNLSFKIRNFYNPTNQNILILISNQYKDEYILKVAKEILK